MESSQHSVVAVAAEAEAEVEVVEAQEEQWVYKQAELEKQHNP